MHGLERNFLFDWRLLMVIPRAGLGFEVGHHVNMPRQVSGMVLHSGKEGRGERVLTGLA